MHTIEGGTMRAQRVSGCRNSSEIRKMFNLVKLCISGKVTYVSKNKMYVLIPSEDLTIKITESIVHNSLI